MMAAAHLQQSPPPHCHPIQQQQPHVYVGSLRFTEQLAMNGGLTSSGLTPKQHYRSLKKNFENLVYV
jgi:hypothetical protein